MNLKITPKSGSRAVCTTESEGHSLIEQAQYKVAVKIVDMLGEEVIKVA